MCPHIITRRGNTATSEILDKVGKKKKGDVLQMLILSSAEETASVDLCNCAPRNSSTSFHSSSPVSS